MAVVTSGICRDCRKPVLKGHAGSRFVMLEIGEFKTDVVPDQERYAVVRGRGLLSIGWLSSTPERCFREHRCADSFTTTAGGRLYNDVCPLCHATVMRGPLMTGRNVLVEDDPDGEWVMTRQDYPTKRWVITVPTGLTLPAADHFAPHWRYCTKLEAWRAVVDLNPTLRGCLACGQPMMGRLADPTHRTCGGIGSIYVAGLYPFGSAEWEGIPGWEKPSTRRTGDEDQCAAETRYAGQCQFSRDSDPDFTREHKTFCRRHNPARQCGRRTHANTACYSYTVDGRACDFHEGMPRMRTDITV
jgi:hypothetical protein